MLIIFIVILFGFALGWFLFIVIDLAFIVILVGFMCIAVSCVGV